MGKTKFDAPKHSTVLMQNQKGICGLLWLCWWRRALQCLLPCELAWQGHG